MRVLLAVLLMAGAVWPQVPETRRNFVACPMVRDTKTNACWLAEYEGQVYFLGIQGGVADDFYPPQLEHEVLVEGVVVAGPRVCGGIPLKPLKISVLPEITRPCSLMLPAEDGIEAPARVRGGRPDSWVKEEGPGTTTLFFDFDNDFLSLHSGGALVKAAAYFKQSGATRIEVSGYRAASLLSSGKTMTEKAGLAQVRAGKVAESLVGLGVPAGAVKVRAVENLELADGVSDAWKRRVVVTVQR